MIMVVFRGRLRADVNLNALVPLRERMAALAAAMPGAARLASRGLS